MDEKHRRIESAIREEDGTNKDSPTYDNRDREHIDHANADGFSYSPTQFPKYTSSSFFQGSSQPSRLSQLQSPFHHDASDHPQSSTTLPYLHNEYPSHSASFTPQLPLQNRVTSYVLGAPSTATAGGLYQTSVPSDDVFGNPVAAVMHPSTHTYPLALRAQGFGLRDSNCLMKFHKEPGFEDAPEMLGLDEFDLQLMGQPPVDRRTDAANGRTRLSLPSRSIVTPNPRILVPAFGSAIRHPSPTFRNPYSSSSAIEPPSSPSLALSKQRQAARQASKSNNLISSKSLSVSHSQALMSQNQLALGHAPPIVQGISLVSVHELPDRFRSVFKFPLFNAVQSRTFDTIFKSDDNVVIAAPTGAGKTAIMELAICRLVDRMKSDQCKVVYQAPTKSLCSERQRDWGAKFATFALSCAELTGDTESVNLRNVQSANIIITTPEKWDSMTRKWKDHARLMQLVKLFLIDEVHILKESRGATLEAVVSRMKSVGSGVRFVALSATIPNAEDISDWLGKNSTNSHLPAHLGKFGEEFRPVKLQKFVYGYDTPANDFAFDKMCDTKLSEIISKHGEKKPIMIFCMTRAIAAQTAKLLTASFNATNHTYRQWRAPTKPIRVEDAELQATIAAGVAFHHAGLNPGDRIAVEKGYLDGQINVICCTSTLAVGVNLPCHLVIIKNTMTWTDTGVKEYADLEVMQMLGRAGRPQFDKTGVGIIMTRKSRASYFDKMISGQECLESCLHQNLINHLNAEIGLGTVNDVHSARKWLAGTFLYLRLGKNPGHYKLADASQGNDIDVWLDSICKKDIKLLQENELVSSSPDGVTLKCTPFGEAMARYYVKFETMKILLALPSKAKISEILSVLSKADEFHDIRMKATEKGLYKEINKATGIKFPIKEDIALTSHKVSLSIQAELGGVEFPGGNQFLKHKSQFRTDKLLMFSHVNRLVRCVVDCFLHRADSVTVRNALSLTRSLGAGVWDNSPLQMKQIEQLGVVAVRKLAAVGVNTIEVLQLTEASKIDTILSKQPPFGRSILAKLDHFPKLWVTARIMTKESKYGKSPVIKFKVELGFLNETPPLFFNRRQISVCFMAETSDGRLIEFRKLSATKLRNGHDMVLSVELPTPSSYILCHVMCDEVAGTSRSAELKPTTLASTFTEPKPLLIDANLMNTAQRKDTKSQLAKGFRTASQVLRDEEFAFDINEAELLAAAEEVEEYRVKQGAFDLSEGKNQRDVLKVDKVKTSKTRNPSICLDEQPSEPVQLENGKYACNHTCKDKQFCRHLCCREGIDKPRKRTRKPTGATKVYDNVAAQIENQILEDGQTVLRLGTKLPGSKRKQGHQTNESLQIMQLIRESERQEQSIKRLKTGPRPNLVQSTEDVEVLDLTNVEDDLGVINGVPKSMLRRQGNLRPLCEVNSCETKSIGICSENKSDASNIPAQHQSVLSDLPDNGNRQKRPPSHYECNKWMEELPFADALIGGSGAKTRESWKPNSRNHSYSVFDEDLSDLEAGMIGLDDSLNLENNPGYGMMDQDGLAPFDDFLPRTEYDDPMASKTNKENHQLSIEQHSSSSNTTVEDPRASLSDHLKLFVSLDEVELSSGCRVSETSVTRSRSVFQSSEEADLFYDDGAPDDADYPHSRREDEQDKRGQDALPEVAASKRKYPAWLEADDISQELIDLLGDSVTYV